MEVPDKVGRALARPEKCHIRKGVEIYYKQIAVFQAPSEFPLTEGRRRRCDYSFYSFFYSYVISSGTIMAK